MHPSPETDHTEQKAALRTKMQHQRSAINSIDARSAAESIANHFADHPYLTYAKSFAGYYPFRNELDVLSIFHHMQTFKKQMALPRIAPDGKTLTFKLWEPGVMLETDRYGIKTPKAECETIIPEVILVPLLAVDNQGYRLGYGGGYYDRTIAYLRATQDKAPLCIGVAYPLQEIESVPHQAHDEQLDGLLTPEGVSMFR